MNLLEKINKKELEKYVKDKPLSQIPLKSHVSIQYLTANKDKRIFRGIVIAKNNKGLNSSLTVTRTDSDAGNRLSYKFLYFSPNLLSVTVDRLCSKKPRRAKLFYMEELFGKKARI